MHSHNHNHNHKGSEGSEGNEGNEGNEGSEGSEGNGGNEGGLVLDVLLSYCNTNPIMGSWLAFFDDCDGQVFRNSRRQILLVSKVDGSIYNIRTPRRKFASNRTWNFKRFHDNIVTSTYAAITSSYSH